MPRKFELAASGALLAAQNTASLSGRNQSASGSVGISFGTSGFGVSASVSSSRGKEAGDDLIHTHTHITAGNTVRIQSGNDTTLQGALVKADTIQADVGGDLKIESLQDTSTYTSQQKSSSASVTVGAGVSGSFSSSKSNVKSDFASVAEQSGLKAGDGGFQVRVGGNTDLIGGAITSNQVAVEQGRNRFSTGGTLTTSDMENTAEYTAKSASVSLSGGSDENKKNTTSGVGAGVGRDTGGASSTTRAGISGIAGDTALRSTDAETGIARIFEKEAVQRDIEAQARITEAFSREAPKAVASYAANQSNALREQLRTETDPARRAALQAEMDHWSEGGVYRVALHTVAGALGGGVNGALGAAASSASAPVMDALQDTLQQSLMAAGLRATAAKGVAQGITTLTAAGVGAAVGGTYGAASAATVDANNRQLHPSERRLAQELAGKSNGKYTAEQVEEQMRLMGNKAFNEPANKTEVLTTTQAIASNIAQDPNMPKAIDGMSVVEIPGQANAELQQYIIGNSQGADYIPGQPPYVASNAGLNRPTTTYGPNGTTATTARCANGDLACISGVGQQQNEPLTPQQQKAAGDFFGQTSTNYQRMSTLFLAAGQPNIALAYEVAAAVSGLLEQAFTPSAGKVVVDTLAVDTAAKVFSDTSGIPLVFVNEVAEQLVKPNLQGLRDQINKAGVGKSEK